MAPAPIKPLIPFAQFEGIDIRAGTIECVSDVPDSNKLVRFDVDFGDRLPAILPAALEAGSVSPAYRS